MVGLTNALRNMGVKDLASTGWSVWSRLRMLCMRVVECAYIDIGLVVRGGSGTLPVLSDSHKFGHVFGLIGGYIKKPCTEDFCKRVRLGYIGQ